MMALHASQLPEPGSFVTVQLNRTNALVTRGKEEMKMTQATASRTTQHQAFIKGVHGIRYQVTDVARSVGRRGGQAEERRPLDELACQCVQPVAQLRVRVVEHPDHDPEAHGPRMV